MIALIIAGAFLLLLILILLLPCRAEIAYQNQYFSWNIRIGLISLLSSNKRKVKKTTEKSNEKTETASESKGKKHNVSYYKALLSLAFTVLKKLLDAAYVERLRLHFFSAFCDPYDTTMAYAYAGTAMETFSRACGDRIKTLDLHTELDYDAEQPNFEAALIVSARLYKLLIIALFAWNEYKRLKRRLFTEERTDQDGKTTDIGTDGQLD